MVFVGVCPEYLHRLATKFQWAIPMALLLYRAFSTVLTRLLSYRIFWHFLWSSFVYSTRSMWDTLAGDEFYNADGLIYIYLCGQNVRVNFGCVMSIFYRYWYALFQCLSVFCHNNPGYVK